jgi:ABC-type proline/glycine betaine transport system ATPase subunit
MAILLKGKLRQLGTPDEIYSNPVDDEVRNFLGLSSSK